MILILAFFEGSAIFAASGALLALAQPGLGGGRDPLTVLVGAGWLALSCLLAFYYAGLYDLRVIRSFEAQLARIPHALAAAAILVALGSRLVTAMRITDNVLESGLLATIGIVFGLFLPLRAVAYRLIRTRRFVQRLLIIGASPLAWRLIHEIEGRLDYRYAVAAIVDDASEGTDAPLVMGPLDRLAEIVDEVKPDRIVLALPDWRGRVPIRELLKARVYHGIPIQDSVEVYERLTGKLAIEALTPSHLIFSDGFCQSRLTQVVRRGVSILVATVGIAVTMPLLVLIAVAVRLDSAGPVLFRQERLGFHGTPFVLLKFRTMHPTDRPTSEWERDNRARMTRVGRWLRRFWLDELPQLANILRGDMDVVGPRPHPVSNAALFMQNVPYYSLRMAVRPGLTGWAQVRNGYANSLDEETEKMRHDLYYIKHRSLWLDLRILFATAKIALGTRDHDAAEPASGRGLRPAAGAMSAPPAVTPDFAVIGGAGGGPYGYGPAEDDAVTVAREPL